MRRLSIVTLSVCLIVPSAPAVAGELSGTVTSGGAPVANLTVTVQGGGETTTNASGRYELELNDGNYTLMVKGQPFQVTVEGNTPFDIPL